MFARFLGMMEALTAILMFFGDVKGAVFFIMNIMMRIMVEIQLKTSEQSMDGVTQTMNSIVLLGIGIAIYFHQIDQ